MMFNVYRDLGYWGKTVPYVGLGIAKTGNVGSETEPAVYGDGLLWVEATDLGDNLVQLESTGMWGSGRATLGLVVERIEAFRETPPPPDWDGVHVMKTKG